MAYENKIKFYEEQIEALLYNIEEKEKSYICEQVRIIKQKIDELKKQIVFPPSVQAVGRVQRPAADFCHDWQQ